MVNVKAHTRKTKKGHTIVKAHARKVSPVLTKTKLSKADIEFNQLISSGDLVETIDGFGNFLGYEDEAGRTFETKSDVIDEMGLGED